MARSKFSNNKSSTHRVKKYDSAPPRQFDKEKEQETYGAEYTFSAEELSRIKYK